MNFKDYVLIAVFFLIILVNYLIAFVAYKLFGYDMNSTQFALLVVQICLLSYGKETSSDTQGN
jgi:hypothetical protein